ncbi:transcription initiation factor TFIID subunit 3-like isoform X2 [Apis dorsata]|uniref:transcription initiation factor TFIID subunit 3-like isoform X2 n=1 Tax=Apis dorsata TaxID=7462 RepID=UPI0012937C14|nr:transcription initiation factor TFIID subunit 3-like isoform X2 [Apis dorsata]
MVFMDESELSSKRWASAPRRPDSPCVLGAPTSREAAGPPVQLEPVDLSVKTPVVLQVPRYSPAAIITATARRIPSPSTTPTPPPLSASTVSPPLPPVVETAWDRNRERERERVRERSTENEHRDRQLDRESGIRERETRDREKERDRDRERQRDRERDVSVRMMEPLDPVFVSPSAALLALQRIKETSLRETVSVHMGGLHVEIRTFRRINAALSQAYGPEAVQVPSLPTIVLAERPLIASHEKALIKRTVLAHGRKKKKKKKKWNEGGKKEEERHPSRPGKWGPRLLLVRSDGRRRRRRR